MENFPAYKIQVYPPPHHTILLMNVLSYTVYISVKKVSCLLFFQCEKGDHFTSCEVDFQSDFSMPQFENL